MTVKKDLVHVSRYHSLVRHQVIWDQRIALPFKHGMENLQELEETVKTSPHASKRDMLRIGGAIELEIGSTEFATVITVIGMQHPTGIVKPHEGLRLLKMW